MVGGWVGGWFHGEFSVSFGSTPKFCSFDLDLDQAEQNLYLYRASYLFNHKESQFVLAYENMLSLRIVIRRGNAVWGGNINGEICF